MQIQASLFVMKYWKHILIAGVFIIMALVTTLFGGFEEEPAPYSGDGTGGQAQVSALVRQYQPLVEKYAALYGIPNYVELLLAYMMQESGGRVPDVMQSSESLGLPPNTITDPEVSIDAGVRYFAGMLTAANGDIKLALQSYNFGGGFIPFALERGGYSKQVAGEFSDMMAIQLGWPRYGDINYVDNVLRYYTGASYAGTLPVNSLGFVKPVNGQITSNFGYRSDPFTGIPTLHSGTDFGCNKQPLEIYATKGGVVTKAGWQNPNNPKEGFGQRVYIDNGNGLVTVYGHLSEILVAPGQNIEQSQVIGKCGTTGSSTGMHLHFETHLNGAKVDPMQFIGGN